MTTDNSFYSDENCAIGVRGAIGLLTEDVTAKVLLLNSVGTLATWRSLNKGPQYVKLGKRVFYTVKDLAAWIQSEGAKQIEAANAEAVLKVAA